MVNSSTVSITPATHADRHRHGGADPLTGDVRIDNLITDADLALGILPTITPAWLVPAATLVNVTDGDMATFTTGGTDNASGADNEIIKVDLGAIMDVKEVYYNLSAYTQFIADFTLYVDVSPDNAAWTELYTITNTLAATWERWAGLVSPLEPIRYIRIRAKQNVGSGDYRYRLYSIGAY